MASKMKMMPRCIEKIREYMRPDSKAMSPKDLAVARFGIAQQVKKDAEHAIKDAKVALVDLGFDTSKLGDGDHTLHDSSELTLEASICAVGGRLTEGTLRAALKKRGYSAATVNAIVDDAKTGSSTRATLKVTAK